MERVRDTTPVHPNGHWKSIGSTDDNDKYTASIELSNRCREFYNSRLEAANTIKARWSQNGQKDFDSASDKIVLPTSSSSSSVSSSSSMSSSKSSSSSSSSSSSCNTDVRQPSCKRRPQRTSIDTAMEKLRSEMMSLMDQDLSLMKQLLTLNEAIEDLKKQRSYCTSWASMSTSRNLDSDWSISDTEMYGSESDVTATNVAPSSYWSKAGHVVSTLATDRCTPSAEKECNKDDDRMSLSSLTMKINSMSIAHSTFQRSNDLSDFQLSEKTVSSHTDKSEKQNGDFYGKRDGLMTSGHPITIHHDREQNSFDSGIHDLTACDYEEVEWTV